MKVIYTDQCYESLDESLFFLLEEQNIPLESILDLRKKLLDKADSLITTYHHYQKEEYLKHPGKIIEEPLKAISKLFTE